MITRWLSAFLFTQLVEVPIYRRLLGVGFARAFGASAITHPIVWGVFMHLGRQAGFSYATRAVSAELFAWLFEAAYFFLLARRVSSAPDVTGLANGAPPPRAAPAPTTVTRAVLVSLVANGASLGLGLLAYELFRWP